MKPAVKNEGILISFFVCFLNSLGTGTSIEKILIFFVCFLLLQTEEFEGTETQLQKTSKINLIDLAGSERAKKVLDDKIIHGSPQVMETRLKVSNM